ncbi:MAG TPA: helix-hairpin-helix domain-containing protein [Thermoleophilaceae bacterium]|nr:helix-hairpin-helix domain-containing protein [Thermoleophilaceae bacterium]
MDDRGWPAVAWGVVAVVAVLLGVRLVGGGDPAPPPVELGVAGAGGQRSGDRAERPLGPFVHVAGAVRRPGLYRLSAGARVAAAVRRAGGPASDADLDLINLAARLQDGQQVVVPAEATPGVAVGGGDAAASPPISLGSATVDQLDELDGIGPTLAERIVEHRQAKGGFGSLDQLAEVEGIGEKRLQALKAALAP